MVLSQIITRTVNPTRIACRNLSTEKVSDPIQKLFLEKIREFRTANKGLDAAHERALNEEMLRLRRVYKIHDENKLAQLDHKFSNEHDISLHDIDTSKQLRAQIESGEYQKQLVAKPKPQSAILASIPEQVTQDLHLPPLNKPDPMLITGDAGVPDAPVLGEALPDYDYVGDKMTPERLQKEINVKFSDDMPTIHDDKAPGRDAKNYPRFPQPLDTPPTRHHIIPESWFQFFYPKTGVTGPYTFAASFGTFLLSKEWIPIESEFLVGMSSIVLLTYGITKYGSMISKPLRQGIEKECQSWENWQQGHIELLQKLQDHYSNQASKDLVINKLYEARRQDVDLQLECEYRNRVQKIYEDTKRRLDYLVATANSQRQIHHSNMVNWVISGAKASIGQKQENEVLDSCILSLRQLGAKHANAI